MQWKHKIESISSIMIRLESEDLSDVKKNALYSTLAEKIVKLTKDTDKAETLIQAEKQQIEKRGTSPQTYLCEEDISMEEIVSSYYSNFCYKGAEKVDTMRGNSSLTISELLLLLGSYAWLQHSHYPYLQRLKREQKKLQKRTDKKYKYYLNKKEGLAELDRLLEEEERVNRNISEEEWISSYYLGTITRNILLEVSHYLGGELEDLSQDEINSILGESLRFSYRFPAVKQMVNERKINPVYSFDEGILLQKCGDTIPELKKFLKQQKENVLAQYRKTKTSN